MDNGYLTTQVSTIVRSLHDYFDEIGVPDHDRDAREAALYAALSETLQTQLRLVAAEKNALVEEANKLITTIRQMSRSMDDSARDSPDDPDSDGLVITYPLRQCVDFLNEKHASLSRQYNERFDQVKKLVKALDSYASQMEAGFIRIPLPNLSNPSITFKITTSYLQTLDTEFSRVYEEFTRRIATTKNLCSEIVQLWAELGTPAVQTDRAVVECCRNTTDRFDVKAEDMTRLRAKKQKLQDEKTLRERKIEELKYQVQALWEKFNMDEAEMKAFTAAHRGCGLSVVQRWETELARLIEVKKQHIHVFVEDARHVLQDLWDNLYFSEEEMLAFAPAFSDVYTDALLEAHEIEINRLQKLMDERAPILTMVEKYQTLMNDKSSLEASSQDSSRLLGKGPRDPTRLLREEKMRKKIAKDLPKVESDLIAALEEWEDEHGEHFMVNGTSYMETLLDNQRPSSKTSHTSSSAASVLKATANKAAVPKPGPTPRAAARPGSAAGQRTITKTPTTVRSNAQRAAATTTPTPHSRVPLSNCPQGANSPERKTAIPVSRSKTPVPTGRKTPTANNVTKTPTSGGTVRRMPAYMAQQMAQNSVNSVAKPGPPKMRPLNEMKENMIPQKTMQRPVFDGYDSTKSTPMFSPEESYRSDNYISYKPQTSYEENNRITSQTSNSSSHATGTSSENWETFGEDTDEEPESTTHYYDKLRAVKEKRNFDHYGSGNKKARGIPGGGMHQPTDDDIWVDEIF